MGGTKEDKKKAKEVDDCQRIVEAINQRDGTDYAAYPCWQEPADVIFKSRSGLHPARQVQVVTVPIVTEADPLAYTIRSDNQNAARFVKQLKAALICTGVTGAHVGVLVQPQTACGCVPQEVINTLATTIANAAISASECKPTEIDWLDLFGVEQELVAYVTKVVVWRNSSMGEVLVDLPGLPAALPADGRWIWRGIETKLGKYPGAHGSLILAVQSEALIDAEQIAAFRIEHPPGSMPFAEVWVDAADGPVCLQPRALTAARSFMRYPLKCALRWWGHLRRRAEHAEPDRTDAASAGK